jgi:sugar lactone lactonase YvrE
MTNLAQHPWTTLVAEPSQLAECPFWHPQEQTLYWVDIAGCQIKRANVYMGTVESWPMLVDGKPTEPGCMAPARSGGLVIALRDRIVRARTWGGALETLHLFAHDPSTTRANDGKCDSAGRFWVGTMYEPRDANKAELLCLDARNNSNNPNPNSNPNASPNAASTTQAAITVERKAGDATVANGLAWSPDARTLYWADTPQHAVFAWDYDLASNAMTRHRVFKQFPPKPAGWLPFAPHNGGYLGRPDGASVDVLGNYWVAMYEGQRVLQIAASGEILRDIPAPVLCTTMVCFGGEDLQTLYLTSARHGRSAADLLVQPELGCVFSMRVDVPGLPVQYFED